jgi:hypothetical protein
MRKLFYSSLALFLLVIIFLLAYNFAFKNNANDAKVPSPSKEATNTDDSEEGFGKEKSAVIATAVTNPINENILGASTGPDDSLFYYSYDDQSFKKATLEGKNKTVLLSNLPGKPIRIVWSPKRDAALVLIEGAPSNRWHTATFGTKSLTPLKPEILRITWNGLGDKIYYVFKNASGEFSLNRSNPDGSDWKEVTSLGSRDVFLGTIPQSNRVSFWTRPNGLEESLLDAIDVDGSNRTKLFSGRFGGDYLWSPNGEQIAVSASLSKGGPVTLAIMNKNGGELQSLNIPTLISKVVWSKDGSKLFYALPGGLDQSLLPNDYFEKKLSSQDTFWQVDLGTGKSSRLLELADIGQSFDSIDLSLSAAEDILFFTDRSTQRVYRIDL